jgi:hypothetical protein
VLRIVPQKPPHPGGLFGLAAWPNLCSWGAEPPRRPLVINSAAELVNRQSRIKPHGVMPGRFFASSARATLAGTLTPINYAETECI